MTFLLVFCPIRTPHKSELDEENAAEKRHARRNHAQTRLLALKTRSGISQHVYLTQKTIDRQTSSIRVYSVHACV